MSEDIALSVRNLGKSYVIRHEATASSEPRENSFSGRLARAVGRNHGRQTSETFWALKDVSFNVKRGQVLGVIGRNGAGKSTLLKILSRITEPTTGFAEVRGKVSSLLEVGTGFHPELTGRENIYLNGTLLGMRKKQIDRIFDEIVAFSEVERFLDTPVKRYSSGMYVRLAFAVAAHIEPDILIIDEVLAVGDMQFQKKCLGKMKDVSGHGRTVLFVSHNLTTINSLCDSCILLSGGEVEAQGPTEVVTKKYFSKFGPEGGSVIHFQPGEQPGDNRARCLSARLVDINRNDVEFMRVGQAAGLEMTFEILGEAGLYVPNFHVFSQGTCVFISSPRVEKSLGKGIHKATMWFPDRLLNEGSYIVNLALTTMSPQCVHFHVQDRLLFSVVDNIHDPERNSYVHSVPGLVRPKLEWTLE